VQGADVQVEYVLKIVLEKDAHLLRLYGKYRAEKTLQGLVVDATPGYASKERAMMEGFKRFIRGAGEPSSL